MEGLQKVMGLCMGTIIIEDKLNIKRYIPVLLTLEGISLKKLHEGIRGGGWSIRPLPSTFDSIHLID